MWIKTAWQCILLEVTEGFNEVWYIPCSGWDFEGNGDLRSECEEDGDTDCEDGNSDTDW